MDASYVLNNCSVLVFEEEFDFFHALPVEMAEHMSEFAFGEGHFLTEDFLDPLFELAEVKVTAIELNETTTDMRCVVALKKKERIGLAHWTHPKILAKNPVQQG